MAYEPKESGGKCAEDVDVELKPENLTGIEFVDSDSKVCDDGHHDVKNH